MVKKINERIFKSVNGLELIVKNRKSAVIFEMEQDQAGEKYDFVFEFTLEVFAELLKHLESVSNESWSNVNPRVADSEASDYYEYYDRKLDNNGYLGIGKSGLSIERPTNECGRLYQFNKRKMESFIYDFRKKVVLED